MRTRAGFPGCDLSPDLVIERLLAAGRLPPSKACACCGAETDEVLRVVVECERAWVRRTGGFSWAVLLLSALFLPVRIWLWEKCEEREFGKDKIYPLPLPVCLGCRSALCDTRSIKLALRKVPDYARLLDKFPNAKVTA
jgi:hypothetical protein